MPANAESGARCAPYNPSAATGGLINETEEEEGVSGPGEGPARKDAARKVGFGWHWRPADGGLQ